VYSGEPLKRLIDRYADNAMIAAIAAQAAKGRLLLVATTDLATGEPVIWDLSSIALHGGKTAKPLIRSVLLASASVPGMLPPVVVKFRYRGRMRAETHVDGGVTLPFFITPALQDLPRFTRPGEQTTLVHVIINGPLHNAPLPTHDNAFSVFRRSLSAGLSHETRTQLEATVAALHREGIAIDYAAIPASYPLSGTFDFSPKAQRSLFEYAESCSSSSRIWVGDRADTNGEVRELTPAMAGPICPADDFYFEHLAALVN
jgi:predicted acylesterase/phospholipase RssA